MSMLKTFLELAATDSLSYEERPAADFIIEYLLGLGIKCEEDGAGRKIGGNCGNLIIRLKGTASGPAIMLSSHIDTVAPGHGVKPVIKAGYVRSSGDTVLGADDKAGVAVILHVVKTLISGGYSYPDIVVVFTVAEEVGLKGSQNLNFSRIKAGTCYVLDDNGPVGKITTKAPYQDFFGCTFKGRAAHAGIEPERGRSAVLAAADAVGRMRLGRIDGETTANIGKIAGGTAINVVPREASIEGEARGHSLRRLSEQIGLMKKACADAAESAGVRQKTEVRRLYDGFSIEASQPIVQHAVAAAKRAGFKPIIGMSGGGSDTNVFNAAGITAVNLGVGYDRVHTTDERIAVESLDKAFRFVMALVAEARP